MLLRGLPLYTGIAPVVGVALAYWMGVSNDVLPGCMPLIDGCTSISSTGRYLPGSLLFRAVMLPQAFVLAMLWYLSARWLDALSGADRSNVTLLVAGLGGALALVLYVTFLGTRQPFYEVMRRFGIYFYFLGTAVAQLTLALSLLKIAAQRTDALLRRYAVTMLWLCGLPFALGLLLSALKTTLENADMAENRIEWIAALFMQAYFVVLYLAWRSTRVSVAIRVD